MASFIFITFVLFVQFKMFVSGKVFSCDQSLAPVQSSLDNTSTTMLSGPNNIGIPVSISGNVVGLSMRVAPVQLFSLNGPPNITELACKSEMTEKTFTFCVANSCKGTATCEGCVSDFGTIKKLKCMSYNIQDKRNFCQDINGIKFLCYGSCSTRTACSECEFDNVRKTKAFVPPWVNEMVALPLSKASRKLTQPIFSTPILVLMFVLVNWLLPVS